MWIRAYSAENAYANKVATSIARYDNFQLDYPGQRGKSANTQYPLLYSAPSRTTTFPPTDSSMAFIHWQVQRQLKETDKF